MYNHLFLAGTFDGLHAGHRAILTRAFVEGERVTIGLTSDQFVAKFKSQIPNSKSQTNSKSKIQKTIKSFKERKRNLEAWLRKQRLFDRSTIIPIDDPYEPAAGMKDLDALIVTPENRATGERINELRQGSTLPRLILIEVPMVVAADGKPVSSTRMRNGEIDSDGRLIMPESMRTILGKPLGAVLEGAAITASIARSLRHAIITVGDIATKTLLDAGIIPKLAIIDGMVGREPFSEVADRFNDATVVKSGPGYISREAMEAIKDCLSYHVSRITYHVILIDGEEDLLVLPAILHAPLGTILYYGQPGEGLVEVKITKPLKEKARLLLGQFFS